MHGLSDNVKYFLAIICSIAYAFISVVYKKRKVKAKTKKIILFQIKANIETEYNFGITTN